MSNVIDGLFYSKEDEWVSVNGDVATVGVTDYAQDSLSDIVYVELPAIGRTLTAGEAFGVVESVKAAADLYAPVSGKVVAINKTVTSETELVNSDPYEAAWMIKIELSDPSELDSLMDAEAYRAYLASRA